MSARITCKRVMLEFGSPFVIIIISLLFFNTLRQLLYNFGSYLYLKEINALQITADETYIQMKYVVKIGRSSLGHRTIYI